MCFAKRTEHDTGALLQEPVLLRRQESRAQHGAQRPVAEEETARAELIVELLLAVGGELVRQKFVVFVDAVHRGHPLRAEGARGI
jgi:hypothetical protein